MKKIIYVLATLFALTIVISISGCSNQTPKNNTTNNTTSSTDLQAFTADSLLKYDGQNGNPAYVAVNGKVYDVTNAKDWKDGKHKSGVTAGKDLSSVIGQSPHGDSVLKDLPVVGTYN